MSVTSSQIEICVMLVLWAWTDLVRTHARTGDFHGGGHCAVLPGRRADLLAANRRCGGENVRRLSPEREKSDGAKSDTGWLYRYEYGMLRALGMRHAVLFTLLFFQVPSNNTTAKHSSQ